MRTIDQVIAGLPKVHSPELPAPEHTPREGPRIGLAVESMKRHTTDEGWQLFAGLESAGYGLCGYGFPPDDATHVPFILTKQPGTVVVQDKREWAYVPGNFREPRAEFTNVRSLRGCGAFVLTVLKDAHQRQEYHRESADEMGTHAWVTYYNPRVVKHLAPYVREKHLVRTWHSLDRDSVLEYSADRRGCLLSGAVSGAYPLRQRLFADARMLPETTVMHHPGYHRNGCATPAFLKELSKYKVAICTASVYGYALRKIAEATACGCVVVTDLPTDEMMPEIDGNLVRVGSDKRTHQMGYLLQELYEKYDPEAQRRWAEKALWYDYRATGARLAADIEELRLNYA